MQQISFTGDLFYPNANLYNYGGINLVVCVQL